MRNNESTLIATRPLPESTTDDRLAQILDDYLTTIERGLPIQPEELLARYPNEAAKLREYLSGLELFHAAAAGLPDGASSGNLTGSAPPSALQVIGDYQLVREIGRGGMGVVYEAWQVSLQRRVALKVLPFTAAHDAKQINRFKNEAQAAAQIQHPNIVPVFAVGEQDGVHYYVMQLVSGQSLTNLLEQLRTTAVDSPESPNATGAAETGDHIRAVARLGVQAAEALHAAHDYGVVHRDVKPSNLLLDDHGKLWVTDFGLARCRENQGLTQTGDVLGTMRYMSPEQALGRSGLIDHRIDIYSLGVTLYELATLCHPAEGVSDLQLYFDRSRPNVKPLRHWNRHIPVDFQTIVMKAISEFPFERYQTSQEFADDLNRFLEWRPIQASPPTAAVRASKWAKRHRRALTACLLAGLLGIAAYIRVLVREQAATRHALENSNVSLREAHDILDRFGSQLVDELAAIPGAEGVRHELLEDSFDYYRRQSGEDDSLSADVAMSRSKMAGLAEKLGDDSQALEQYTKACQIWLQRVATEPANQSHVRYLAVCRNNRGLLLSHMGQASQGLRELRLALNEQRKLVERIPDSPELAAELATTHNNLGLVLSETGSADDAAKEFHCAIDIQEKLAQSSPQDETVLRGLAASYNNLSSVIEAAEPVAASELYKQAIRIQRRLVQANPINRLYQGDLARTYNNFGFLSSRRNDWKTAELCYQDAIRIQENLIKASPLAGVYRRDLAISYNNLGMVQNQIGQLAQAAASFQQAVRLQERLLQAQPNDLQTLSNQGSVFNNLGMLYDRQNKLAEAESAYRTAIECQKQVFDTMPEKDRSRQLLSKHYANYARNLRLQGKLADADKITAKRQELWAGLVNKELSAEKSDGDLPSIVKPPATQQVSVSNLNRTN